MAIVSIYALCEPEHPEIVRYVGRTSIPLKRRLATHMSPATLARGTSPATWLRSLRDQGLKPITRLLEEVPEENWREAEYRWIQFYRQQGADLLNISPGGYVVDERVRSTMRLPNPSTPHSAKQNAMSSERAKRLWTDPEWRAKRSASLQKNKAALTNEQRKAKSEQARKASRAHWDSPEHRAKTLEKRTSSEYHAKLSESAKKRAAREGETLRQRMREAQAIRWQRRASEQAQE